MELMVWLHSPARRESLRREMDGGTRRGEGEEEKWQRRSAHSIEKCTYISPTLHARFK